MRIHLSGVLGFYLPGHPTWVETPLESPIRLSTVLERLGIPPAEVYLAAVNGDVVDLTKVVVGEGDEVRLYPPIGGG